MATNCRSKQSITTRREGVWQFSVTRNENLIWNNLLVKICRDDISADALQQKLHSIGVDQFHCMESLETW